MVMGNVLRILGMCLFIISNIEYLGFSNVQEATYDLVLSLMLFYQSDRAYAECERKPSEKN